MRHAHIIHEPNVETVCANCFFYPKPLNYYFVKEKSNYNSHKMWKVEKSSGINSVTFATNLICEKSTLLFHAKKKKKIIPIHTFAHTFSLFSPCILRRRRSIIIKPKEYSHPTIRLQGRVAMILHKKPRIYTHTHTFTNAYIRSSLRQNIRDVHK